MASIDDVISRLDKMTTTLNDVKTQVTTTNEKFDSVTPKINALERDMSAVKKEVVALKERTIQLEAYIKCDNLIFGGLTESNPEDCENKVKFLISNSLKLPCEDMKFVRAHRLGKYVPGKVRPIIVRFHFFGDRQSVWKARGELKDTNFWVSEDFPKEIQERRRTLKQILSYAIQTKGKENKFLAGDRLFIDGDMYTVDTLSSLPPDLCPSKVSTREIGDNLIAFFNELSPLSNFHKAPFTLAGVEYQHVEQYFTAKRAEITENPEVKMSIMHEVSPYKCKQLAKKLPMNQAWKRAQHNVMTEACTAKFNQNPALREFLLKTENKTLVEARADDKFWGAGVNYDNDLLAKGQWPGKNVLGTILMKVRDELK